MDGIMEKFLSNYRAKYADLQIDNELRSGTVLDIGCGDSAIFLNSTRFNSKIGIDRLCDCWWDCRYVQHDLACSSILPVLSDSISVVTLLAVMEHLDYDSITAILLEIMRVLRPGGQVVITSPSAGTQELLTILAKLNILSMAQISEHKTLFTLSSLRLIMEQSGFNMVTVRRFQLGVNLCAIARK